MLSNSVLPDHLVIEILARLPLKSFVPFKCVAKSWLALSKKPLFINERLTRFAPLQTICLFVYDAYNSVLSDFYGSITEVTEPRIMVKKYFKRHMKNPIQILGPCNGIFCLIGSFKNESQSSYKFTHGYEIVLWNPTTTETKHLPEIMPRQITNSLEYIYNFGFGIDPNTNDFKVVSVLEVMKFQSVYEHSLRNQVVVEVYNLSIDSWKPIPITSLEPLIGYCIPKASCSLNGVQYWLTDLKGQMLSFHLGNHVFRWIPLPRARDFNKGKSTIVVSHGSLFCIASEYDNCEVWVMNEKYDNEPWTRLSQFLSRRDTRFLTVWKDDLILTKSDWRYKPEVRSINMGSEVWETIDKKDCSKAFVYKVSLVVLNGEKDLGRNRVAEIS